MKDLKELLRNALRLIEGDNMDLDENNAGDCCDSIWITMDENKHSQDEMDAANAYVQLYWSWYHGNQTVAQIEETKAKILKVLREE